jgi:phage terminase small subunit
MPTPLKPSLLKELNGSFASHPDRKRVRADEPKPTKPIGGPPKAFTDEQKKLWKDFVKTVPAGVLFDCDKYAVEILVVLICQFRAGTIKSMGMTTMNSLLSRFGLTPADRARVKASGNEAKEDEWDALLRTAAKA